HEFSEAALQEMASGYNPLLREAPLTVGHPASNLPAYGWVKSVQTANGVLSINTHQVEHQFSEMVQTGRFKKRSASFYPPQSPNNPTPGKWYLRHVAFLGAQPPAVAGLKDIEFSEDDAGGAVSFSESVTADPSTQESLSMTEAEIKAMQDQLAAEKKARIEADAKAKASEDEATAAKAAAASFAEKAANDRKASFVSFAESQVKAGKLLPKDQAMAVATLVALDDAKPVEFSEGDITRKVSPSQWLQDLIANAKPQVEFGEFAGGNSGTSVQAGTAHGKSDAEVDKAAKAYASQHKVDYSEALRAVTSFTSAA
ncbi:MAG: hypothetical protein RSD82_07770, partial [Comamonas sp.]